MSGRMTAAVFGVTPKTLRDWTERGCPRNPDGTYNTAAVFAWRIDRESERGASAAQTGDSNERWQRARAELKELELAERLKLFLRAEDVEQQWARALTCFSQNLQAIPHKLAPRLEGRTKQDIYDMVERELEYAANSIRAVYEKCEDQLGSEYD